MVCFTLHYSKWTKYEDILLLQCPPSFAVVTYQQAPKRRRRRSTKRRNESLPKSSTSMNYHLTMFQFELRPPCFSMLVHETFFFSFFNELDHFYCFTVFYLLDFAPFPSHLLHIVCIVFTHKQGLFTVKQTAMVWCICRCVVWGQRHFKTRHGNVFQGISVLIRL